MGVVPAGAVLLRLELVGESRSRCDGALGNTRCAVVPWRVPLRDAVPVDRGTLFRRRDVVVDRHLNHVTPVGFDQRAGELVVDQDDIAENAVCRDPAASHGEVVVARHARDGDVIGDGRVRVLSRAHVPRRLLVDLGLRDV